MSAEESKQEPQTHKARLAENQTHGSSFESENVAVGKALEFAHSELAATHRNYDSERKHKTQTLLLTKGFHLLGWILGVFVYWLLFHDSVHDILRALIDALSCSFCQP